MAFLTHLSGLPPKPEPVLSQRECLERPQLESTNPTPVCLVSISNTSRDTGARARNPPSSPEGAERDKIPCSGKLEGVLTHPRMRQCLKGSHSILCDPGEAHPGSSDLGKLPPLG